MSAIMRLGAGATGLYAAVTWASLALPPYSLTNSIASITSTVFSNTLKDFLDSYLHPDYQGFSTKLANMAMIPIGLSNLLSLFPDCFINAQNVLRDYSAPLGQGTIALYLSLYSTHRLFFYEGKVQTSIPIPIILSGAFTLNAMIDGLKYITREQNEGFFNLIPYLSSCLTLAASYLFKPHLESNEL